MGRMVKGMSQSPAVGSVVETVVRAEDMEEIVVMGAGHLDHFSDLGEEGAMQDLPPLT